MSNGSVTETFTRGGRLYKEGDSGEELMGEMLNFGKELKYHDDRDNDGLWSAKTLFGYVPAGGDTSYYEVAGKSFDRSLLRSQLRSQFQADIGAHSPDYEDRAGYSYKKLDLKGVSPSKFAESWTGKKEKEKITDKIFKWLR